MIARWMIVGFVIWIAIAVAFRFFGVEAFAAGGDSVTWLFLTLPLLMLALTFAMMKLLKVSPGDRAEAASIMAVPGLLVGIYEINSFNQLFPGLDAALGAQFAALMFACCAAVIITGVVTSRLENI